jgi:hypothetical protein
VLVSSSFPVNQEYTWNQLKTGNQKVHQVLREYPVVGEMGLFWSTNARKSINQKGENCEGRKHYSVRLSVPWSAVLLVKRESL